jgi:DNA-binding CsgD family transcriptional regulator
MCDDNPTIGQATASPVDWSWRRQAACRSADPAVFYGPEGERPTRKRAREGRRPGDQEYQPTLTRWTYAMKTENKVTHCVTCGIGLHPERAEKYNYCTKRTCREENAEPLTIAAVGVNKAADHYMVLNDRAKEDLAAGRYQDARKSSSITGERARGATRIPAAGTRAKPVRRTPAGRTPARQPARPSWTRAQEDLALIYSNQGLRPDEIARRLGVSRYTATQMVLAAKRRVQR